MIGGRARKNRLLIVTDAWHPQVNGVVRSLTHMAELGPEFGFEVDVVGPADFRTFPCPTYSEIRLVAARRKTVENRLSSLQPDFVHIATEGPLGWRARRWCRAENRRFTTSYHTKFPDYVSARFPVPREWIYGVLRQFHAPAEACLVPTKGVQTELESQGFSNLHIWSRGVNSQLFHPASRLQESLPDTARQRALYVGRVAPEKNLDAFLAADVPMDKIVVGDGPDLERLKRRYPTTLFLGKREGAPLAGIYAACDVFVFPSRTDTFGIVLLEALASGLPIAAFPVTGPKDVVGSQVTKAGISGKEVSVLDDDLARAITRAVVLDRQKCRAFGAAHSWNAVAQHFYDILETANQSQAIAA